MTLHIEYPEVRRGRRRVLEADTIVAPAPAAVGIIGVNGSGKTSLFMHLADVLVAARRTPSRVRLGGGRPEIAWVTQTPALPEWLDASGIALLYGLSFNAMSERMPGLHLDELRGRTVGSMSLGQRQALAIALALGTHAGLILMDEPFSALDFRRRHAVLHLLRERSAAGTALLLSSQVLGDLLDVCNHLVVLREGRQLFQGSPAQLGGGTTVAHAELESRLVGMLA